MEFTGEIPEDFQRALKKSDLEIDEITRLTDGRENE